MSKALLIGYTLILSSLLGCMSSQSTLLHRDENNQCWQRERKMKGVPITLKVPTHIKIDVIEHHYLTESTAIDSDENESKTVVWFDPGSPIRSTKSEIIETEKIFTVDAKRPAAGKLDTTLTFKDQYFDQIDYDVTDETISDITNLIGNVAKGGLVGAPTSSGEDVDLVLKEVQSHVASAVFELDSPMVETDIQNFLLKHISGCHTCTTHEGGTIAAIPVIASGG